MKIPFVDLRNSSIQEEINRNISEVIESGVFILGKNVKLFEEEFAKYCGAKYGVGVASGSDALMLSLKSLGIEKGDEVITLSKTFISTVDAISHSDATPVLVDIDPETYNIDPPQIEKKITKKTKAVIPVHLYGQPADMDPVKEIAEKHGLYIIEDACQAHGATYKNRKVGSLGHIACFSFYPSKNLGAFGDGGMAITHDKSIAERIKMLRNYGQRKKYHHDFIGYNSRLDEIQAAVLRVKLQYLDKWNDMRRKNARLYSELLMKTNEIVVPLEKEFTKHVYHLYVIRSKKRAKLQEHLASKKISTGIHYPVPIHLLEAYKHLGIGKGSFPLTEKYSNEILSLPMFPGLEDNEIEYVCINIKEFYRMK